MKKFIEYIEILVEDAPIFGLTGAATVEADSLLVKKKYIPVSSEQIGAVAASAYGWATGHPGILFVTAGPGLLQAVSAITCAKIERWPLIVFAGYPHIDSPYSFQSYSMEIPRNCATYAVALDSLANDNIDHLHKAYNVAQNGSSVVIVDKNLWLIGQDNDQIAFSQKVDEDTEGIVDAMINFIRNKELVVLHAGADLLRYPQAMGLLNDIAKFSAQIVITTAFAPAVFTSDQNDFILGCLRPNKNSTAVKAVELAQEIIAFGVDQDYPFLNGVPYQKVSFQLDENSCDTSLCGWNRSYRKIIKVDNLFKVLELFVRKFLWGQSAGWTDLKSSLMVFDFTRELSEWRESFLNAPYKSSDYYIGHTANILHKQERLMLVVDVGNFSYATLSALRLGRESSVLFSSRYAPIGFSIAAAVGLLEANQKRIVILIGDGALLNQIGSLIDLKAAINRRQDAQVFIQVLVDGVYKSVENYERDASVSSIKELLSAIDAKGYMQALGIILGIKLDDFLKNTVESGLYLDFYDCR